MADANDSLGKDDISKAFQDSLAKANESLSKHDYKDGEDTAKLFGIVEMDSGMVSWATGLYNALIGVAANKWSPQIYGTIRSRASEYLKGSALDRTAAGGALAINTALYVLPHGGKLIELIRNQHKERNELVRSIAPVLDEIKGHHSLAVFYGIKESDNEVIYAQRRRMLKINHAKNIKETLGLAVKIAPNLLREGDHFFAFMEGKPSTGFALHQEKMQLVNRHRKEVAGYRNIDPKQVTFRDLEQTANAYSGPLYKNQGLRRDLERLNPKPHNQYGRDHDSYGHGRSEMSATGAGFFAANFSIAPMVDKYIQSSQHRLEKTLQPYSALDMILELEKQIKSGNTDGFSLPGDKGGSLPLDAYIAQVIIQHQKDMSDLDPKYTQIREALHKDLEKTVQPIAEAIKNGDLAPLALVRLVGEGHIIKGKGRSIADAESVGAIVDKMSGKKQATVSVDPKEFFAESPFTHDDLKVALNNLEGEERTLFAAMFSDEVLKQGGMDEKDIKNVRDTVKKDIYEHMVAALVAGVPVEEAEQLKKDGLAEKEVTRIGEAQNTLKEEGEQAVHKLKTSPVNTDGIEHSLVNLIVTKLRGDRTYFGKLRAEGEKKLAHMQPSAAGKESNDNEPAEEQKPARHATREETRRGANDNDMDAVGHSA
ncbi:MAG: hypothetical protein WDN72_04650 [Alphaproteobacteria bacterium]